MAPATSTSTFNCDVCGQSHDLPMNMGFSEPDYVNKLLPWDKESQCQISPDWCIVEDQLFYIRGCLQIPIIDTNKVFTWGVWSTLSIDDFDRTMELWDSPQRVQEPEYLGALANTLPTHIETRNLPTAIQTRSVGDRPLIRVTDPDHILGKSQSEGIGFSEIIELAKLVIHGQASNPWSHLCEQ